MGRCWPRRPCRWRATGEKLHELPGGSPTRAGKLALSRCGAPENLFLGGLNLAKAQGSESLERFEAGGFEREGHFGVGPIVT